MSKKFVKMIVDRLKVEALIKWSLSLEDWVCLNMDRLCKGGNQIGCGGINRGGSGDWLEDFTKCVARCGVCVAELWGLLEGLYCARCMEFRFVELHIDSQVVVKMLTRS